MNNYLKAIQDRRRKGYDLNASPAEITQQLGEDFEYLFQRALILDEIASTWVAIEECGTEEDAKDFYTTVQKIMGG